MDSKTASQRSKASLLFNTKASSLSVVTCQKKDEIFSDFSDEETEGGDFESMDSKTASQRSKVSLLFNTKASSLRSKRTRDAAKRLLDDLFDQLEVEPLDLLDRHKMRSALRSSEHLKRKAESDDEPEMDSEGRLIIREGGKPKKETYSDLNTDARSDAVAGKSARPRTFRQEVEEVEEEEEIKSGEESEEEPEDLESKKLQQGSELARVKPKEMDLLESILALEGNFILPQDLKEDIEAVQISGGPAGLEPELQQLRDLRRVNQELLVQTEELLQKEAREDSQFRGQFGTRWTRPQSSTLTKNLQDRLNRFAANLKQAADSDARIERSVKDHLPLMSILDRRLIESALPTLARPIMSMDANEDAIVGALKESLRQLETLGAQRAGLEDMLKEMKRKMAIVSSYICEKRFDAQYSSSQLSPMVSFLLIEGIGHNTNGSVFVPGLKKMCKEGAYWVWGTEDLSN